MPHTEDYQAKLEIISAISEQDLKSPAMPVDVYLQEAENLFHWASDDKEALMGVGLDWEWVADLKGRTDALRQLESIWYKTRFSQEEAVREWKTASEQGYDQRDQLLHTFRYAYRKDPGLLARVSGIADGNGHADMIQDLNDIAVLGKAHIEPLLNIKFDPAELDRAHASSAYLSDLLARATVDREENTRTRVLRDQAYTHLKEAVDEVRDCGQYVFARNEARLKGYFSQYYKKANSAKSKNTPPATPGTESVQ